MYKMIIMFYTACKHPCCSGVISMAEILTGHSNGRIL